MYEALLERRGSGGVEARGLQFSLQTLDRGAILDRPLVIRDPERRVVESARPEPAVARAADLLGRDESNVFEDAEMLLESGLARSGTGSGGERHCLTGSIDRVDSGGAVTHRGRPLLSWGIWGCPLAS